MTATRHGLHWLATSWLVGMSAAQLCVTVAIFARAPDAAAAVAQRTATFDDDRTFPKAPFVRKQVRFWEKVFGKYPSTTVIVHDMDDPDRIIDLIDYKTFATRTNKTGPVPRKEREDVTAKYLKRYTKAVERFAAEQHRALRYGAIEKRVYNIYRSDPKALQKLYDGEIKIRAQTGLADDFLGAAKVAQTYLPYMERVFTQHGVPARLTRLAFVESMFNLRARSKVGASGLWQFMPETARHYVYVNSLVDERNSPYKATRAAAQFLLGNFQELKAWPLAITAYNHGRLGMAKAAKALGTNDMGQIILRYESKSFGFASRNFYSEFLAAANVYDRLESEGKIETPDAAPDHETIVLKRPFSVHQLVTKTPLTKEVLASHNPCLLESTLTVNAKKPLPAFYELIVPRALARSVVTALINLHDTRYATR